MIKPILNYLLAGMYIEAERLISHLRPKELEELCELIQEYGDDFVESVVDNTHIKTWVNAIGR